MVEFNWGFLNYKSSEMSWNLQRPRTLSAYALLSPVSLSAWFLALWMTGNPALRSCPPTNTHVPLRPSPSPIGLLGSKPKQGSLLSLKLWIKDKSDIHLRQEIVLFIILFKAKENSQIPRTASTSFAEREKRFRKAARWGCREMTTASKEPLSLSWPCWQ